MPNAIVTFRRTQVYASAATVGEVVRDLRAIQSIGAEHALRRRRSAIGFWIAFAAASLCMFLAGLGLYAALAALAVVLTMIVFSIVWRWSATRCFLPRFGALLEGVRVSRDMAPDAPVEVRLDLRKHDHPSKLAGAYQNNGWNVKSYVDPWLYLTGRLLDGNSFALTVVARTQNRSRWARGSSGKYKRKTKRKTTTLLSLRLKFKPDRYPEFARIADPWGAIQLPLGAQRRGLDATPDSVTLSVLLEKWNDVVRNPSSGGWAAETGDMSGAHTVAMMFLSLYQLLNVSKARTKLLKQGGAR